MRTDDRIVTTHVGSLPRGERLSELLIHGEAGDVVDQNELRSEIERRVAYVVSRQMEARIDIGNDGEQGRAGFQTYIAGRMVGFDGESDRPYPRDYTDFPGFAALTRRRLGKVAKIRNAPKAVAPVGYGGFDAVATDCDILEWATAGDNDARFREVFMTAPSPGIIATTLMNEYYDSHEAYVMALSGEMAKEYEFILSRGFILQIDAPDLAMERCTLFQNEPLERFLEIVEMHIEALNRAIAGLDRDRIRLHCCWGNWDGPHMHDVPLADVLPKLYRANVGALSIPFANPRHQHEYEAIRNNPLPDHMTLIPGVIDTTTNYVEHPEVVAERIVRAVDTVGERQRVIAGTDCGFGTFAGYEFVAEDVIWAKLAALCQGAELASARR